MRLCSGYEDAALKTQSSLAFLNFGQTLVFSTALSAAMVLSSNDIMNGVATVGDLVNALYNPALAFKFVYIYIYICMYVCTKGFVAIFTH